MPQALAWLQLQHMTQHGLRGTTSSDFGAVPLQHHIYDLPSPLSDNPAIALPSHFKEQAIWKG